jgi:adenine-specific DNA-methyltransferase
MGLREKNRTAWYPIFIRDDYTGIHSVGDAVYNNDKPIKIPPKTIAMWPPTRNNRQYSWSVVPETLRSLIKKGAVKTGNPNRKDKTIPIYYLSQNQLQQIEDGILKIEGKTKDGILKLRYYEGSKTTAPKTIWNMTSHDAGSHGTNLLSALIPSHHFTYPKSLYAVEDSLRFFIANNPNAIILDFFAGSGTTAHAVMRLNRQDGGQRQSISITNNEVSDEEAKALKKQKLRSGDDKWEKWGICEYITKPRIKASITGKTPKGKDIEGDYKFTDEFPMSEGFEENAEFFNLTYETSLAIEHNLAFERIAPLLWIRAGSQGRRIDKLPSAGWEIADTYALLTNLDKAKALYEVVAEHAYIRIVYIVTDDDRCFQSIVQDLPKNIETVRLHESFISNFQFSTGR